MSKYTTEVRYICEELSGGSDKSGLQKIDDIINKSWRKIFTTNWEIFDENYRSVLCKKILKVFYTREICAETVGLWQLWMDATLCEIMPYYNKLYNSELIKFNLFDNISIKRETEKTSNEKTENEMNTESNGTNGGTTENISNTTDKYSDTPQGGLNDIENNKYLTNARIVENGNTLNSEESTSNNTSGNSKEESNSTEKYVETLTGKNNGDSNVKLLMEFRESFLNIDSMIIKDLESLFFTLW